MKDPFSGTGIDIKHEPRQLTREQILSSDICRQIKIAPNINEAFTIMRRGYPEAPPDEQCQGQEFRDSSAVVMEVIAKETLNDFGRDSVVLLPWRSGLAFGASFRAVGAENFYHISSRRNEETLQPEVDYTAGELEPTDRVIIADPMLATGGTIVDAIERLMREQNIEEQNILINAVVAAPEGVTKIYRAFPRTKIVVGSVDNSLDERGYIAPGLGDFGDKYFHGMSHEDLEQFIGQFMLPEEGHNRAMERFKQH